VQLKEELKTNKRKRVSFSGRDAVTKVQAAIIAIIIIIALIVGIYYATLPGPSPSPTQKQPITIAFGAQQIIATVDPCIAYDATSNTAVHNFYDSIVELGEGGIIKPGIATNWTVSPDGLTYTFNIRQGVKFHDGTLLTAMDVAFSINRMLALGKGMSYIWAPFMTDQSAEATDNYTVKVHMKSPFGLLVNTFVSIYVINEKLAMSHKEAGDFGEYGDYAQAWLAEHEAGSGPYFLKSWVRGTQMTFQKFEDYWKGWTADQPDTVYFKIMPEEAAVKIALEIGDIDIAHHYLTLQTFKELEAYPGIVVQKDPSYELIHYLMNNQKPPTDDVHVRRAISYAFDYETALKEILTGCSQAQGPVVNAMPEHNSSVLTYHYDLDKARSELAQSKYTLEELASMTLDCVYVSGLEWEERLSALLKDSLSKIGLNVQLKPMVWTAMVALTTSPETTPHFFCLSSTASYVSADYFLMRYTLNATGYTSAMWVKDKQLSDAILQARMTIDPEQRAKLYKDLQGIIAERACCLWIANGVHRIAYRDYIHGYVYYGLLSFDEYWWNLHIKKGE
jgi:peptide/nickel transport system substrate-binding protein